MLFIWFTRATALSSLFSLFASPLFLIFYHPCLHAQPLPFSLSIEINFLTLSCRSLLSRVYSWQLGWVLIGFTMVWSVLRWGFVCLIDFFFFFSRMMVVMQLWVLCLMRFFFFFPSRWWLVVEWVLWLVGCGGSWLWFSFFSFFFFLVFSGGD